MRGFFVLFLTLLALPAILSFPNEKRNLPTLEYDPDWSTYCPIPDCEKIQRALRYPSPQKRNYYQCVYDGKRWIPQLFPCACDLIFVYQEQSCVYPWEMQEWCSSDYVVDIRPISCDGGKV